MQALIAANAEPIPGYRLLEPLGKGGFGEVWKCEAPGGLYKAIKIVPGAKNGLHADFAGAEQELRALQHVKSLRHPFLLSIERVEVVNGDLLIVMELADRNLHDLLDQNRAAGRPGVPRAELLHYMFEAAEVLDLMNLEYGLQHLDIKPRNLFLIGRHVKVADFGLVNSLSELQGTETGGLKMGGITPLYASPETFLGKITGCSDQYSLALTYHEVLTGELPFTAKNYRQMAMQHLQAEPDLRRLPESDRPAVARALAKEARQRFPSCTEFVQALESENVDVTPAPSARASVPDLSLSPAVAPPAAGKPAVSAPPTGVQPTVPSTGVLPGYQFLDCVARLPVLEVWKAQAADGKKCLVKFILGVDPAGRGENNPVARLRSLRHDALAPQEVLPAANRLAVVTDPGETTLATRLRECLIEGKTGIPREELLDHMHRVAEALDELSERYHMQHLSLMPRQLVLREGEVYLVDYGLVELFLLPAGQQPAELSPRYAAPELFEGKVSPTSDQYSLALIFLELLTGVHPFRNLNQRQLSSARSRGKPDLGLLPATDRAVVLRALHSDPSRRYSSCTDFIDALEGNPPPEDPGDRPTHVGTNTVPNVPQRPTCTPPDVFGPTLEKLLRELDEEATKGQQMRECGAIRYWVRPGPVLEHQCFARVVLGTVKLKLDGFSQHWEAQRVSMTQTRYVYHVKRAGSLLQRWRGKVPGVQVEIEFLPAQSPNASASPINVTLRPIGFGPGKGGELLDEVGPAILESVRKYLQAHSERGQERYPFPHPVDVFPVLEDGQVGEPYTAQARDLSLGGMGLRLPSQPPTPFVYLEMPRPNRTYTLIVPARVVHSQAAGDGVEVGVAFVPEAEVLGKKK